MKVRRLRRCLNPGCPYTVGGGNIPLRSSWMGEYAKMRCPKCGTINVFNPIGKVRPHATRGTRVAFDSGRKAEFVPAKRKVLVP